MYQKDVSGASVRAELAEIARKISGMVLRDLAVSRLNELYQAEDVSVGNHSSGLSIIDNSGARCASVVDPLRTAILSRVIDINQKISTRAATSEAEKIFDECADAIVTALSGDEWRSLFPGRLLLQKFSTSHSLGDWPVLQNLVIEEMSKTPAAIPAELKNIFDAISP